MDNLKDLAPSTILHNPTYLTLILEWLPPDDMLNCASVSKHWSTNVSQAWKSFLQRISPALYDDAANAVNQNRAQISPEKIFKHFALGEFKLREEAYNLPIDTIKNYRKALKVRELKQRLAEQSQPQVSSNPPTLELEDVLLVVHLYHLPTRTPMCSVIYNMNDVVEDGFIYGVSPPMLSKEVEFRIPTESVEKNHIAVPFAVPFETLMTPPTTAQQSKYVAAAASVQMYRCDIGKAVNFELAQMMQTESHERFLGFVETKLRLSRTDPNPASMPLPQEDLQYWHFDPADFPESMSAGGKGYPYIGFEVGVRKNTELLNVARFTPTHKVGRMTIDVHLRISELFPTHHRTTIRWKEDLRKHLQYMDWE